MSSLDSALELRRRGLSVIPVPRPGRGHDGKIPILKWGEYQKRLPTEDELREWFRVEQNFAVVTGEISGVVVIDADDPRSVEWIVRHLPRTPWQTKTARGFHLWYRHPGGRVGNKARIETRNGRLAIDVRGDGGYVIGPGSIHASGARYQLAGNWSVPKEKIPVFWRGWLQRPERPSPSRPPSIRPTGDLVERARRYLVALPRPEIGRGSDEATLYAACRLVRGFELTESEAVSLLWEWAGGREGWTLEWIEAKVQNAIRYGTEPIGGMR